MPDIKVIRSLLVGHAPLTAVVPAAAIAPGLIAQSTPLPAIGISHVSGVWGKDVSRQSKDCTARVQVTVLAQNYPQQKQVMALVRAAVPRTHGTVAGVVVDSITREDDGPDFADEDAGIYMQTQDFIVKYSE